MQSIFPNKYFIHPYMVPNVCVCVCACMFGHFNIRKNHYTDSNYEFMYVF